MGKMATEAIERVANHNKKVADACAETKALQDKVDATKIKCKLEAAEVRREKIAAEVHERLANHNKRVMELKQVTLWISMPRTTLTVSKPLPLNAVQSSSLRTSKERSCERYLPIPPRLMPRLVGRYSWADNLV